MTINFQNLEEKFFTIFDFERRCKFFLHKMQNNIYN